jgi:hypothetical protein
LNIRFGCLFRLEKLALPFPRSIGRDDEFQALMGVWANPKRFFAHPSNWHLSPFFQQNGVIPRF